MAKGHDRYETSTKMWSSWRSRCRGTPRKNSRENRANGLALVVDRLRTENDALKDRLHALEAEYEKQFQI
jgi:hypothetical protein